MIKIEYTDVYGWEAAIRGARNPMNSWDKSDTVYYPGQDYSCAVKIGPNDLKLLRNLADAGPDHGKYLRMIQVYCDITGPLYWYKELDTYRMGVEKNSCSTMHKIHAKEFTLDDFSCEHLTEWGIDILATTIETLNDAREDYLDFDNLWAKDLLEDGINSKKDLWWQMIQLLPSSYNQRRTYMFSYAALRSIYHARKNHKLDEWREFCRWIEILPYPELITNQEANDNYDEAGIADHH